MRRRNTRPGFFYPLSKPQHRLSNMRDQTTWTLGPAARAAQTSTKTVRRLLDNKTITLRGSDVPSTGSGSYSRLSRNRILQIAITKRLLSIGMALAKAAKAA